MLQLNSALIAIAAEFAGRYSPYQSIEISPDPRGGVYVASTDHGKIACLAFDPVGSGDETVQLLPNNDLIKACRGIKTAERTITIGSNRITESCPAQPPSPANTAIVTTHRKSTNDRVEVPLLYSSIEFPPLAKTLRAMLERWSGLPSTSATAGRYDANYLQKAIKGLTAQNSSVVLSAFDGGPMRIQGDNDSVVILVMPQTAEPIPPIPEWLTAYSRRQETVVSV